MQIRFEIAIAQISDQTNGRSCTIISGPGLMPSMISAPNMIAMPEPAGTPKNSVGKQAAALLRVHAGRRRDHTLDGPFAEALGIFRARHGEGVTHPTRGLPAETGDHADEGPHHRGDEGQGPVSQVVQHTVPDFGEGIAGDLGCALAAAMSGCGAGPTPAAAQLHHLRQGIQGEHATDDIEPVPEEQLVEGEALHARLRIEPDHADQPAESSRR